MELRLLEKKYEGLLEEKTRCEKEYKRDVENDNRLIGKLKREL